MREYSLCALVVAVNGERDALIEEGLVRLLFAALQFVPSQVQKQVVQGAILFSRMIDSAEHWRMNPSSRITIGVIKETEQNARSTLGSGSSDFSDACGGVFVAFRLEFYVGQLLYGPAE